MGMLKNAALVVVMAVAALVVTRILMAEPELSTEGIVRVLSLEERNSIQRARWNASEKHSFLGSHKVPSIPYHPFLSNADFADAVIDGGIPVLVRNMPMRQWKALSLWQQPLYVPSKVRSLFVHTPPTSTIRMHQIDPLHPLSLMPSLNWTKPWIEREVSTALLFGDEPNPRAMYHMSNIASWPADLLEDFGSIEALTPVYSPPLEVNIWIGTPTMTTPAHFDWVHNFYTQVRGNKRFILFAPEEAVKGLYTFSNLHPASRQSQIDLDQPVDPELFPRFKDMKAWEVVLEPGDVLYIPPFYYHHVSVVGDATSVSLSTHSDSHATRIRGTMLRISESFWMQLDIGQYDLCSRIAILQFYVQEICGGIREAAHQAREMLTIHWSHLDLDTGVQGLVEEIEEARTNFPSTNEIAACMSVLDTYVHTELDDEDVSLHDRIIEFTTKHCREDLLAQVKDKSGAKYIILSEHLEYISSRLIGPTYVEPFLRLVASSASEASAM